MKYHVRPAQSFENELEEIYSWIAKDSPANAARWYNHCLDHLESLGHMPTRYPLAPENEAFAHEIRHLILGNYRILFRTEGDTIYVLHIRHAARRPLTPGE